jgi:hypothetical protein
LLLTMLQRIAIKSKPMLCGGQGATSEHEGEGEGQPMHLGPDEIVALLA